MISLPTESVSCIEKHGEKEIWNIFREINEDRIIKYKKKLTPPFGAPQNTVRILYSPDLNPTC